MAFQDGLVQDTTIVGNYFGGDAPAPEADPFSGILFNDISSFRNVVISGNVFSSIGAYAIAALVDTGSVITMDSLVIEGNSFNNIGSDGNANRAHFYTDNNLSGLIFCNNACKDSAPDFVIRFGDAARTLSGSKVWGNTYNPAKTFFSSYTDSGSNAIDINVSHPYAHTAAGRVGIGTNTPARQHHVSGTVAPAQRLTRTGSVAEVGTEYENDNGSFGVFGTPSGVNAGEYVPGADNTIALGSLSARWSEVFAGTGTINTSDIRMKEDIRELDERELAVARELKLLVRRYRFKDKPDNIHVGFMAQHVVAAFARQGLDALDYACVIYSKEVDRWGLRMDQILAFIVAAN